MTPLITRCTFPVFFSKMKKSLLPMKAMLVGCDNPLTTVRTERFGSVIDGPLAGVLIAVCRLTELSFVSGSYSLAAALAVFVRVPADCGTTTMLMMAIPLRASEPRLHVTVVVPLHMPCVGVAEVKLMPMGRLSVTTTFVAGDGPLFVTVNRYVRFASVTPGFGEAVFVSDRLALVGPETIN